MVTIPSAVPAPPGTDVGDYTTAGYFTAVKDTTDALAARDEALKTAVDTLEGALPGKASTSSVTAEATARANADTAEATARAAADTTERAQRQAGDASNAAAAATAHTLALAAQASADAVATRAATLEDETARLATMPIASPGRYPEHWAIYSGGNLVDIPASWVQTSPWGPALKVPANTEVVSRHIYPVLPGRALRCLAGVARAVNSTDEAGEAVRIRARAVDMVGSVIGSPITLHTVNNLTVSPLLYQPPLPDIVLGAIGIAQAEPPTGTVGVRLALSTAAGDAYTWFVDFGALDMARAVAPSVTSTDVTALQAAVNALGTRTTAIETILDGPTRRVFDSYLHFQAATADDLDGILTVGILGWNERNDGGAVVLERDDSGNVEHTLGSTWSRVLDPIAKAEAWGLIAWSAANQGAILMSAMEDMAETGLTLLLPLGDIFLGELVTFPDVKIKGRGIGLTRLLRMAAYGGENAAENGLFRLFVTQAGGVNQFSLEDLTIDTDPSIVEEDGEVQVGKGHGHVLTLTMVNSLIRNVEMNRAKGFGVLIAGAEDSVVDGLYQNYTGALYKTYVGVDGRSGFRINYCSRFHVINSILSGKDDTGTFSAASTQAFTLDGTNTPAVSNNSSYENCLMFASQGRVASVLMGGPYDSVYAAGSDWSTPIITEAGSTRVIILVARISPITVGEPVYIAGVTDEDLAGSGLVAADILGHRLVTEVGVDPEEIGIDKGNPFVTFCIEADTPATVTNNWRVPQENFRAQYMKWQTTSGSAVVTVTCPSHGRVTGNAIQVLGWSGDATGLTLADVTGVRTITVLDANRFTFVADDTASATADSDYEDTAFYFETFRQGEARNLSFTRIYGESGDRQLHGVSGKALVCFNQAVSTLVEIFYERVHVKQRDTTEDEADAVRVSYWEIHGYNGPMQISVKDFTCENPNAVVIDNTALGGDFIDRQPHPGLLVEFDGFRMLSGPRYDKAQVLALCVGTWRFKGVQHLYGTQALWGGDGFVSGVGRASVISLGRYGNFSMNVQEFSAEELHVHDIPSGYAAIEFTWITKVYIDELHVYPQSGATGWTIFRNISDGGAFAAIQEIYIGRIVVHDDAGFGGMASNWNTFKTLPWEIGEVVGVPFPTEGAEMTVADLASFDAADFEGVTVYCPDGNSGAPCVAVSDGTAWKRVAFGATISAS